MKDDKLYLIYIVECIEKIEKYTEGDRESFINSTLIQDAVLRNLQTIGQSAKNISEKVKEVHPEIDWRGIIGFRNVLVHDYLGVNMRQIWDIVERDVPYLKKHIKEILLSLETL